MARGTILSTILTPLLCIIRPITTHRKNADSGLNKLTHDNLVPVLRENKRVNRTRIQLIDLLQLHLIDGLPDIFNPKHPGTGDAQRRVISKQLDKSCLDVLVDLYFGDIGEVVEVGAEGVEVVTDENKVGGGREGEAFDAGGGVRSKGLITTHLQKTNLPCKPLHVIARPHNHYILNMWVPPHLRAPIRIVHLPCNLHQLPSLGHVQHPHLV
jgi:hypothetical protein